MFANPLIHFQRWLQSCIYRYCLTSPWNMNNTPFDLAIGFSRIERLLGVSVKGIPLVTPGKAVTIFDMQMNEESTIRLVAPGKSNPEKGTISYFSLLGSRLLGCKIGDVVEIKIFGRKEIFHITDIEN